MLASILLLKASRNTANRFARMLGLYLHASGVKRRVIEVLDGLGVTEGLSRPRQLQGSSVYAFKGLESIPTHSGGFSQSLRAHYNRILSDKWATAAISWSSTITLVILGRPFTAFTVRLD